MKKIIIFLLVVMIASCKTDKKNTKRQQNFEDQEIVLKTFDNVPCEDTLGIELPSNCDNIEIIRIVEGAKNFRKYTLLANNPVQIRDNILFRSDALHGLTENDVLKLQKMNIKTIVDFRHAMEIEEDPDKKIQGAKSINIAIGRDPSKLDNLIDSVTYKKVRRLFIEGKLKEVDKIMKSLDIELDSAREDRYRQFANNYKPQLSKFMKLLADENNLPLVYHCQGGKDRAGFASALVLKTLGADDETVINDYLTTNLYDYEAVAKGYSYGIDYLKPTIGAHKSQMTAALKAVEDKYGSFENYLKKGLNLTDTEIKNIRQNLKK